MDPVIRSYLDEHGATYTRDALRASLVAAGHDPAAVDGALATWEAERAREGADEKRRTFGRWALSLHVAAVVAVFLLLIALNGISAIGLALAGCAALAVALVIGWAISSLIGRALLPGAGVTLALIAPAISALILGGTCFAVLNSFVGTPPRQGTVRLELLAPQTFDESGDASCYVDSGIPSVQVNSQQPLGTLEGETVGVSVSWYGDDPNNPAPAPSTSISVFLNPTGEGEGSTSFGVIFSTKLEVELAKDALTGTIRFEGLAAEPTGAPGEQPAPAVISGSVSWDCR